MGCSSIERILLLVRMLETIIPRKVLNIRERGMYKNFVNIKSIYVFYDYAFIQFIIYI